MSRLISRQKQIPGGLRFFQPEINWKSTPWASFDSIVSSLIVARSANPAMLARMGWSIDPSQVSEEVDFFNSKLCEQMGWGSYISGGGDSPPKVEPPPPSPISRGLRLVAGAKTIVEWISSGAEAVPQVQADKRAFCCAVDKGDGKPCPHNGSGDLSQWFTVPASEAIRIALSQRQEWNLSSAVDEKLGTCDICLCPMKLKVHMPTANIESHLLPEVKAQLPEWCWIKKNE